MKEIFLDFETFYDDDFSLRKMTPVEYVLDQRFEAIGCAIKLGKDGVSFWCDGGQLQAFFDGLDPNDTMLITHNALFDMCIVAWRFGFVPKLMVCTLSAARATLGHLLRTVSLKAVAKHLGLPDKGDTLIKAKGMTGAMLRANPALWAEYKGYGLNDVELCAGIFEALVRSKIFPTGELVFMDTVLRCAIEPKFKLDTVVLAEHLQEVQDQKEHLLAQAMLVGADGKSDLMSNDRFANLLRNAGVDPPMKMSLVTKQMTYAFARTDEEFLALEEHEDPVVQMLMTARLGHKSTLAESRCGRLIKISELTWPSNRRSNVCMDGAVPVPLRFSAAHTHRLGGDWKLNMQNLPTRGGSNALRRALIPLHPDHEVVSVDASQIEARIVAWICGQWDLVQQFADGADVYSLFATDVFGRPINRKAKLPDGTPDTEQASLGFVGKTGILQLGFGCGDVKFDRTVRMLSQAQMGTMIELGAEEATRIVRGYRRRYPMIPQGWNTLGQHIGVLARGGHAEFGPCTFAKGEVTGPNGLKLRYHDLEYRDGEWCFTYAGKPKRIYGGKLMENTVQFLARIVVSDASTRIRARGLDLALQAHDELAYVVHRDRVADTKALLLEEMARRPWWAPELPLAAEAGHGPSYGDAH